MLVPGSNRRVFGIDKRASLAITGFVADGRQIVNRAREEADNLIMNARKIVFGD